MYEWNTRVRFSECDRDCRLTLLGVLNYFQDCSTFQSEDLGVGVEYLKEKHQAWVINYWQIDFYNSPKLGDEITLGTIPYAFKGFLGYRNFVMKDKEGNPLAMANSIWTLLDMDKLRPTRAEDNTIELYGIAEKMDMEYCDRKCLKLSEEYKVMPSIEVTRLHLDTNNHVNNGKYVELALHYLPENFEIGRLQVEYVKQAVLGDALIPYVSFGDNTVTVFLNDAEGKAYTRLMFSRKS